MNTAVNQARGGKGGPAKAAPVHAPVLDFWHKLQDRERLMLGTALFVVGLALLWWLALRPAWLQVQQGPAKLDALDAQTLEMRRLATETRELRAAPQVSTGQSLAALRAASERLGTGARLSIQGDRAVLTVDGLTSEALRAWLSEVRSGARARAVEAQLSRGAAGFSGSITLSLGGSS